MRVLLAGVLHRADRDARFREPVPIHHAGVQPVLLDARAQG